MSGAPPLFGSAWQVQLLGGLRLHNGDVEIQRFSSRQALLLFARLVLAPRATWLRDDLALAVWPELCVDGVASDAARGRLRRTLSTLRVQLEQPGVTLTSAFDADRDTVRLNAAGFDVDVDRFRRHAARREFAAAHASYRGELLPGLHDGFVDEERERLAARLAWVEAALAGGGDDDAAFDGDGDDGADTPAPAAEARRPIVPYLTRFFGRRAEIDQLCRAVEAQRVVCVTGAGGCGKTRLAAEAAAEIAGLEQVVFVALAECRQPEQLFDHLRAALGLQPSGRPPIEQIAVRLAGQRVLFVLDNFEQLVGDTAGPLLDTLLERLPEARLLLTSRRRLGRGDETVIELAPLPLPEAGADAETVARNPGVALFGDRARAARSDFRVSRLNAAAVADICRLLDGLPLAIELAAAKIRSHTPPDMLRQLQTSLRGLARPSVRAARAGRHASLDAALEWSWRLLAPPARDLLGCLTVFSGGWTPEQALAVGAGEGLPQALDALVRDSLVQAAPADGGAPRLQMLRVVREFVVQRLAGPAAAAARARHRAFFLAQARALDGRHAWPATADLANFGAALASGCDDEDIASAAALVQALAAHWRARGAPDAVVALLQRLAQMPSLPGLPAAQRVDLRVLLAALWLNAGHAKEAHAQVVQALEAAGSDSALQALVVLAQAAVHWRAAHDGERTLELLGQAQALLPADAAAAQRGRWLMLRGAVALEHEDDHGRAAALFEQAERVYSGAGDRRTSLLALPGRAACLLLTERFREAIAVSTAGERLAAALGDVMTQIQLVNRIVNAHESLGELESALAASQREVQLAHAHGSRYFLAFALWNQPPLLARLQRAEDAALLMAFARVYWLRQLPVLSADDEAHVQRVQRQVDAALGAARCKLLWARGEALADGEAIAIASGPSRDRGAGRGAGRGRA